MSRATAETDAFWRELRKGKRAYTARASENGARRTEAPPPAHRLRSADAPTALAAHRAALEHDYFRGNPTRIALLREAARDFDAMMARQKDASRRKGGRRPKPPEVPVDG